MTNEEGELTRTCRRALADLVVSCTVSDADRVVGGSTPCSLCPFFSSLFLRCLPLYHSVVRPPGGGDGDIWCGDEVHRRNTAPLSSLPARPPASASLAGFPLALLLPLVHSRPRTHHGRHTQSLETCVSPRGHVGSPGDRRQRRRRWWATRTPRQRLKVLAETVVRHRPLP